MTMIKVTEQWLENKITELNEWLKLNETGIHFEYAEKKRRRDYYVNRLIDLIESQSKTITILTNETK